MAVVNDDTLIKVKNRSRSNVGYVTDSFKRNFTAGEEKKIPYKELIELQWAPGGARLMDQYLIINDKNALEGLNLIVEPEYFYTEEEVRQLLFGNDNLDEFLDFLDFAPKGAIDIAKDIAVKEKLPDMRKRDALSEKTGLNINNAIMVNDIMEEEAKDAETEGKKQRRVQKDDSTAEPKEADKPTRRVPQYNVVSKK